VCALRRKEFDGLVEARDNQAVTSGREAEILVVVYDFEECPAA
jgi:hypothetical protein